MLATRWWDSLSLAGVYVMLMLVTSRDCGSGPVLERLGDLALTLALAVTINWIRLRARGGPVSLQSLAPPPLDRDRLASVRSLLGAAALTVGAVFVMDVWWGVPCPPPTRHRVAVLAVMVALVMAIFVEASGQRERQA